MFLDQGIQGPLERPAGEVPQEEPHQPDAVFLHPLACRGFFELRHRLYRDAPALFSTG